MAEGQVIDEVAAEVIRDVKVGVTAAFPGTQRVANESITAVGDGIGSYRDIVDGMGPGVIEVELEAIAEVLVQGGEQAVVTRESLIGVHGVLVEL